MVLTILSAGVHGDEPKAVISLQKPDDFGRLFKLEHGARDDIALDTSLCRGAGFSLKVTKDSRGARFVTDYLAYNGELLTFEAAVRFENVTVMGDGSVPFSTPDRNEMVSLMTYDKDRKLVEHGNVVTVFNGTRDWHVQSSSVRCNDLIKYYQIMIAAGDVGDGAVWISGMTLAATGDGPEYRALIVNPSFEFDYGYKGEWTPQQGTDWDGRAATGSADFISYDEQVARTGTRSLRLTGNAAVVSPAFPYRGEKLRASGWWRYEGLGRVEGAALPAQVSLAALQLVGLDADRRPVSHKDVLLNADAPDSDWQPGELAATFGERVEYVQLWCRYLPGVRGTVWFDDVNLEVLDQKYASKPFDAKRCLVTVDADRDLGRFNHAVYGGHVVYVDWALDPPFPDILPAAVEGMDYARLGRTLEPTMYERDDESGRPIHNWSRLDKALDWLVRDAGLKLVFTIDGQAFLPAAFTGAPEAQGKRGNIAVLLAQPKRYMAFLEAMVRHIQERVGTEATESWYWELWNEPGAENFEYDTSAAQYNELYDYTAAVLKKVNPKLKVGGVGGGWTTSFFDHVTVGRNAATGGVGAPVDFYSFHCYYGNPLPVFRTFQESYDAIKRDLEPYPALRNLEIIDTETSVVYGRNALQDTEYAASGLVKSARMHMDNNITVGTFHAVAQRNRREPKRLFTGYPSLFTARGVPSATFNVMRLIHGMKGRRASLETTNEPMDGLASLADDGETLRILLGSFSVDPGVSFTTRVSLTVNWRRARGKPVRVRKYVVDRTHSNAYQLWQGMGSPDDCSDPDLAKLMRAAELHSEDGEALAFGREGRMELAMPSHSAVLLELSVDE